LPLLDKKTPISVVFDAFSAVFEELSINMSSFPPGDVLILTIAYDRNADIFNSFTPDDDALHFVSDVEKHKGEDGKSQETFVEFHRMAWQVDDFWRRMLSS
jgi:hypothetical protein